MRFFENVFSFVVKFRVKHICAQLKRYDTNLALNHYPKYDAIAIMAEHFVLDIHFDALVNQLKFHQLQPLVNSSIYQQLLIFY